MIMMLKHQITYSSLMEAGPSFSNREHLKVLHQTSW